MTDFSQPARARGAARLLGYSHEPTAGERIARTFDRLNALHFDALLPPVPVCRGIPPGPDRDDLDGLTVLRGDPFDEAELVIASIHLGDWLFESPCSSERVRWKVIRATLLHEMVHLAVSLDAIGDRDPIETGHGPLFTSECNRIADQAGWPPVDEPSSSATWPMPSA